MTTDTEHLVEVNEVDVPEVLRPGAIEDPVKGQTRMAKVPHGERRVIARALKRIGGISVSKAELDAFHQLGAGMDSAGMLELARGGAVFSQMQLLKVLKDLNRIYDAATDKGKLKIIPHVTYVTSKLTGANKQMFDDGKREAEVAAVAQAHARPPQQFVPLSIVVNAVPPAAAEKAAVVLAEDSCSRS